LPLITTVTSAVDKRANTPELRNMFVGGRKGKEEIVIDSPSFTIYDTDYSWLFRAFSEEISNRIETPAYVPTISSNFSTSTPDQLIASQITIMKSMQQYFDYTFGICGCGIKALEMGGTREDWQALGAKLQSLRQILAPAESVLYLKDVFDRASSIYTNLLKTYDDPDSMKDWWADILIKCEQTKYGPSGMRSWQVEAYNGWLISFLTGYDKITAEDLASGAYAQKLSCLSSVPLKIVDRIREITESSYLAAGILGFKVERSTTNNLLSLQPAHGWCMFLPDNSPLRS